MGKLSLRQRFTSVMASCCVSTDRCKTSKVSRPRRCHCFRLGSFLSAFGLLQLQPINLRVPQPFQWQRTRVPVGEPGAKGKIRQQWRRACQCENTLARSMPLVHCCSSQENIRIACHVVTKVVAVGPLQGGVYVCVFGHGRWAPRWRVKSRTVRKSVCLCLQGCREC